MRNSHNGFSLIEVLVATVIMAIGILGIAGLQALSLQQNRSSMLRSQALQLGNDIIDRMRANPTQTYAPVYYDTEPPASAENCLFPNTCTPLEMAEYDVALWKCVINPTDSTGVSYEICETLGAVGTSLPEGEAEIRSAGDVHTVRVRWVDERDGTKATITLSTRADG